MSNETEFRVVLCRICLQFALLFAGAWCAVAEETQTLPSPGDYGYRHHQYHHNGTIEELRRKTGRSCCDGMGECRATYVNLPEKQAFVDGRWCPIGDAAVRQDISLPDQYALVCAGTASWPLYPCPVVYCVAVSPGS